MKRLLLIDASSIYWIHWHATADQQVSEAFERTVSKIASLRNGYDYVVVCCDAPPYWRKQIHPDYKAQRAEAPPQAVEQFTRVKERLRADGFLLWEAKGFEADDVIAFAVKHAVVDGLNVVIASADKDLHQLVTDRVHCLSTMSGALYTPEQVFNKHGVAPEKMRDYLALTGDTSDNVPGVPGVGAKTAAVLLNEFGTLAAVIAEAKKPAATSDADESGSRITKPKLKAALIEHEAAALLAHRLVSLRTDVPLDWKEIYVERKPEPLNEQNPANLDDDVPISPKPEKALALAKPKDESEGTGIELRSTAMAATEMWSAALEPRSSKGAWEVATILHNSRLYPKLGSPSAIYAVILRGRSLGLDATTALGAFHNLNGQLTMHADLIEALVLRSGKAEYFEFKHSDRKRAVYVTKRVGGRTEQEIEYTIEDAFNQGLVTRDPAGLDGFKGISESGKPSNWDKVRSTMLRHRCKTQLARAVYADVVLGLYSPEEFEAAITTDGVAA
jgi:5'-3' exonuclease